MKNSISFFFFFFGMITFLFSQEYTITGNVVNAANTPIIFANVLLLTATDSTVINGTSTNEEGIFIFDGVAKGNYVLKASYIESISKPFAIAVSGDSNIGTIRIAETEQLDEVVVTYEKPKLERKVDRLVFNVENTALADGTIWDVLKRTPSVSVVKGTLSIKGTSNIGILINGKKVNIPQSDIINLLSGTSASNIEAIEVITNPPAKYSAEGLMLINIKMKKNLVAGYNGAIFNRYIQAVFAKHTLGTDHYFKGKKTGFSVNYSFTDFKGIKRYTDITNFQDNENVASIWTARQNLITRRKTHTLNAFFDYDINENNIFSLSTINTYSPSINRFGETETQIADLNTSPLSSFDTTNDANKDQVNTSFYADWTHKMDKKGAEFSVGTHYTYYDSENGQDLRTDFLDLDSNLTGENDFTTQQKQQINLYSLQTDFTIPMGEAIRFETGLRYAGIASENTISQQGFDRNQSGIDPTEAGVFSYDEDIYAAYVSLDGKWDTWNLKAGLRSEYTETVGELDTAVAAKENSDLQFFPSLSLQYNPSKKHQYALRYLRRIDRPRYNAINPFQFFQSNNSVVQGNPELVASTRDFITVEYTFDRDYTIGAYYVQKNNPYQQQVFQDNESNLLRFINTNLLSNEGYGFEASISKDISKKWYFYFFLSYYNKEDRFADLETGTIVSNSIWSTYLKVNNTITFLADRSLTADVDFLYVSPVIRGNSRNEGYNELNLNFRKTFWNKNASISVGIVDIFNQGNIFTSRSFLDQNNSSLFRPENRLFTFGLRYKFGNVRIKNNKKSKKVDERRRI